MERIAGRAIGAKQGQWIVLFARAGNWWVQPLASKPLTSLRKDFTWDTKTHMGTEYAALLVEPGYSPPKVADTLPKPGGQILAVVTVAGKPSFFSRTPAAMLRFSGYDWSVMQVPIDIFGLMHINRASNVWTDEKGFLHLRVRRESEGWTGAYMDLTRSLGYGSYSFVIHNMPQFEPDTVLRIRTWDILEAGQNHREIDLQLGQLGDPRAKNGQFDVQPDNTPANIYRFVSPTGSVMHSFRWEPGRLSFSTRQESPAGSRAVAERVFTSGVPSPGGESLQIALFVFGKQGTPQQNGVEVVIEKFTYLP